MKKLVAEILVKALKEKKISMKKEEIEKFIEIPPSHEMGDFAFPCYIFAGRMKQGPNEIALELREKIGNPPKEFEDIQTSGPYINFFLDRKILASNLIKEILTKKNKFGRKESPSEQRIMVEFPAPNTNKPLHVGHLRNMSLGESISRILEFNGDNIIRANLNNDRGIHICKSMAAYKLYGKNKTPGKIKSDHFVGKFYVMFNEKVKKSKGLELESHHLLQKWEEGDKQTHALWSKMNKWALKGFQETYKKFGISFDKEYYESEIYKKGKEIILKGVEDKIFEKRADGAIIVKLGDKLGEKVLLRSDGTSVYITQDLYLAQLKFNQFKLDKSIYVVGNEQEYHFDVLFSILKKLKFPFSTNLFHASHGMVNLPHGKIKSREGKGADADDLINEVQKLVKKELQSRAKLSKRELESRSLKITLAAIKYFLLKIDAKKDMVFNPEESICFEGNTGPYLLYSYARANSILKKTKTKKKQFVIKELEPKEISLIKKLFQFSEIVENSYNTLNPALIANYAYQLSQIFNEFYHDCPVLKSEKTSFRLALVQAFMEVLNSSLNLLGIETLSEM